jgi:hypothetical protein
MTDSRSASLSWCQAPIWDLWPIFLSSWNFLQTVACYFVAPSLTRGRVCNLLYNCFWALPEQSLLGRSLTELTTIFYCLLWDSSTWRARFPYLYPPGTGWPSYTPGTGFPCCRLLQLTGQRWRYSNPPPQSQSHITTDSQSASQSWCQVPIWYPQLILLSPWNFLQTVAFL